MPEREASGDAVGMVLERLDATLRHMAEQQEAVRDLAAGARLPRWTGHEEMVAVDIDGDGMPDIEVPAEAFEEAVQRVRRAPSVPTPAAPTAEALSGALEHSLVPLVRSATRQLDEGRAVNARMVELLDVLKLFLKHLNRQTGASR